MNKPLTTEELAALWVEQNVILDYQPKEEEKEIYDDFYTSSDDYIIHA